MPEATADFSYHDGLNVACETNITFQALLEQEGKRCRFIHIYSDSVGWLKLICLSYSSADTYMDIMRNSPLRSPATYIPMFRKLSCKQQKEH